jgi:membrane fusion protein (multidrug efflux system)
MTQTDFATAAAFVMPEPIQRPWRRLAAPIAAVSVAAAVTVLATFSWDSWAGGMTVQTTNDAYVRAQMTRLSSRVAGEVKAVNTDDYQHVGAGDLLILIDPADYEAQVAQAEAGVASAQAALDNLANQAKLQSATITQAEAQHLSALALETEARQEHERQQTLTQTQSGTRQKSEQAVAAYAKAQADVTASGAVTAAQRHQLEVLAGTRLQRAADLLGAQATLAAARLRLGYTRIVAPFEGVVGERQVQPGDYVNIGSSLIDVVPLPRVYVVANYKETQLTRVRSGQHVEIVVSRSTGALHVSLPRAVRNSRCCRLITPQEISPRLCSGLRSVLKSIRGNLSSSAYYPACRRRLGSAPTKRWQDRMAEANVIKCGPVSTGAIGI